MFVNLINSDTRGCTNNGLNVVGFLILSQNVFYMSSDRYERVSVKHVKNMGLAKLVGDARLGLLKSINN